MCCSKSINLHHKLLFSANLRADIRQDVIIQDSVNLEDVKTVAMRVEASVKDHKKSSEIVEVSEIAEKTEETEDFEVDAIHSNSQRLLRQYERRGCRALARGYRNA